MITSLHAIGEHPDGSIIGALIDVVAFDLMGCKTKWPARLFGARAFGWMALAICYSAFSFVLIQQQTGGWLVAVWLHYAAGCAAIAFRAMGVKHRMAELP